MQCHPRRLVRLRHGVDAHAFARGGIDIRVAYARGLDELEGRLPSDLLDRLGFSQQGGTQFHTQLG